MILKPVHSWLRKYYFRNKTFVFQDRKLKFSASFWLKILWNHAKFQLIQRTHRKNQNKSCLYKLNELKFCEVSQSSKSNRYWKCQLSILENKKVLFLKQKWSKPYGQISSFINQQMAPWWRNFHWRFWFPQPTFRMLKLAQWPF